MSDGWQSVGGARTREQLVSLRIKPGVGRGAVLFVRPLSVLGSVSLDFDKSTK